MEDFTSLTCLSVFSVLVWLRLKLFICLSACFSPWDYVYSLHFCGEIAGVFSNLRIAFSICLCMPGRCMQKKKKENSLLSVPSTFLHVFISSLWILSTYWTSRSCKIFSARSVSWNSTSTDAALQPEGQGIFPVVPKRFLKPWLDVLARNLDCCSKLFPPAFESWANIGMIGVTLFPLLGYSLPSWEVD